MPTFVLMTRLASDALHDAHGRRQRGSAWLDHVRKACPEVKWLGHWALLGPYDFMDLYEAPDVESAVRVSLVSRTEGAVTAESWPAVPYERYLAMLDQV